MNSHRDNSVHIAESSDPVIQREQMYSCIINILFPRMVVIRFPVDQLVNYTRHKIESCYLIKQGTVSKLSIPEGG